MLLESLEQEMAWADAHLWIISIRLRNRLWRGVGGNWKIICETIISKSHGEQEKGMEVSLTRSPSSLEQIMRGAK